MAKKNKKSKVAEESSAFDIIDVKNQGQMLDYLKESLEVRSKLTTEQRDSLNISKQLHKLGVQILADQDASEKIARKAKDIAKDLTDVKKTETRLTKEIDLLKDATTKKEKDRLKVAQDQLDITEKLKNEHISGHVHFNKGYRSELANIVASKL